MFQQHHSPTLHLHHEGLFNGDPAAVDDHTLVVRQVPVVGVLELNGVKHRLSGETQKHPHSLRTQSFSSYLQHHLNVILNTLPVSIQAEGDDNL